MLKLILREDRYDIKKEYKLRFLIMLTTFLIFNFAIFSLYLLAPFFEIKTDLEIVTKQFNEINNSTDTKIRKDYLELVKIVNEKNNNIQNKVINNSFLIKEIVALSNEKISLNYLSIQLEDNNSEKIANIELKGVSKTRDGLIDFQKSLLTKDSLFVGVDIPFSYFTKNTDVVFTANIKTSDLFKYLENNGQ